MLFYYYSVLSYNLRFELSYDNADTSNHRHALKTLKKPQLTPLTWLCFYEL